MLNINELSFQCIEKCNCNLDEIIEYVKKFDYVPMNQYRKPEDKNGPLENATPEELTRKLSCLGEVRFIGVAFGMR